MTEEITPTGFVLTYAKDRAEREYPYSMEFDMMCMQAIMGEDALTLPELIATRKLDDHEGAAVNAVFSALSAAVRSRSGDNIMGVASFGLPLIAKWAAYLVALERHPSFDYRTNHEADG